MTAQANAFDRQFTLRMTRDATAVAADLFREAFALDFPTPRVIRYGEVESQPGDWRQAVALYRWPDGREECVGFANWIKHGDVYLGGALCVKRDFYRRLPREQYIDCKEQGGVGRLLGKLSDAELTDCVAWFGYCGDTKAFRTDLRIGFVPTHRKFILVKWIARLSENEKVALIDEIATLGPF